MDQIKERAIPTAALNKPGTRRALQAVRIVWAFHPTSLRASVVYGRKLWEDIADGGPHAEEFDLRAGPPDVLVFSVEDNRDVSRLLSAIARAKRTSGRI